MTAEDPRLAEAKAMPIEGIAGGLGVEGLRRSGQELTGPCPACAGVDRFSINVQKNIFNCRHCGGGDGIRLVELVKACTFAEALAYLAGDRDQAIDPAELERRKKRNEEQQRRRDQEAAEFRARAIEDGRNIWKNAIGFDRAPLFDYFKRRGLNLNRLPACLRYNPRRPYYVAKPGGGFEAVHTGPCMIAAIQRPDAYVAAVHQTWIDLDQPDGKAVILDRDGVRQQSKKMRGSKKGNAIRLTSKTVHSDVLVMGEGIETTLTAMISGVYPGAMFWAGGDLGNMAGRMARVEGQRWSGMPDMTDGEAFLPPPWIRRLIFIQDGDSNARKTRAQLESGLRRAMAQIPDLVGQIVHPGEGVDLNDLLKGGNA